MALFGREVAATQRSALLLLLSLFLLLSIWIPGGGAEESPYEIAHYGFEVPGSMIHRIQPAIGSIGRRWLLQQSNSSDGDGSGSSDDNDDDDDDETITISHQAIAGIAVGVFFVIAFVVLGVYLCRTRKYIEQRREASLARARAAELGWAGVDLEAGGTSCVEILPIFFEITKGQDDGEESARLEEATWRAPQVVSLILEKFVALRLVHGSVDALHFSVLCMLCNFDLLGNDQACFQCLNADPISAVPSITAIGYQGVKLWEQNGFITPEELSKRLQYAVDTFQFQVQTAMAALLGMPTASSRLETPESAASSKPEEPTQTLSSSLETPQNAASSKPEEPTQTLSSSLESPQNAASSKPEEPTQTLPASKEASLCKVEEKNETLATTSDPGDELSKPVPRTESDRGEELSEDTSQMPVLTAQAMEEEIQTPPDQSVEPVEEVKGCVLEVPVAKKKTTTPPSPPPPEPRPLRIPDKVHLQVKLTDGAVIRREFEKSDTLWTVKSFVDENRTDGNASYAFAVPFPRKIFNAEDYEKALVDLDIGYRAVLILLRSPAAMTLITREKRRHPRRDPLAGEVTSTL
ncbi:hypothetical protein SELMODRAFT_444830 [Selaginella moellendorffii]|uniref:UBX domain-containing protein n=1 Tax=Selaginella moellendorffii TaxID=88036 RepID=D8SDA8_SELML|nr:hypothetical protein SELMODRAFT_444830 [Selaginella moellendorffii]